MSTSITVEFQVNDLDANYEVLGTSDNYSFQEKLGLGSSLVLNEGEEFVKVIPLKGNYGVFDIRVFAVTDIGVRSPSLIGSVEVLPKELENTFTFSEIKITDNKYENLESSITYTPQYPGDKLEIESEFAERSIKFSWNLVPPDGHPLEGAAVSNQLLNDTFFSGFKVNIKNNGQTINLSDAGFSSTSLDALSNTFETDKENVFDILQNYRDFYLNFDNSVFNDLGLSRNVELEIISVDRFGREATGIIRANNPEPVINNLTHSLHGSEASFSWSYQDLDFSSVDINVLAVPEGTILPFDQDLDLSAKHFQSLKQAKPYNKYKGAYYNDGEKVVYDNRVYNCISGHTREFNETPDYSESWELIGNVVDFNYFSSADDDNKNLIEDVSLSDTVDVENTFNVPQLWGYEYYYTFQPSDGFGEGQVYNFTNRGLIRRGDENDELDPLIVNIKLDNLRFREVKDDLVFNWDVTDQDGNLVDISQYKFLFGNNDTPSLLGISGSLYDVHSRQKITGITDGYNSKGLDFDEDGDLVVNTNLPSTKVFDQYKYTRESNNAIYATGGFPSDYQDYDNQVVYNVGDNVLSNNKIYTSNTSNNSHSPSYPLWQESETYFAETSDKFVYKNNVYVTTDNFGADADTTSGLYNEGESYNLGDIVLSPEKNIAIFEEQEAYSPGDFVFHSGSIYECLIDISTEEIALIENKDYWRRSDIFGDIKCSYFKSLTSSNTSYPFSSTLNWEKLNPENLAANAQFFDVFAPAYEFSISDWNSGSKYSSGSFVVYENDIWSGTQLSQGQAPSGTSEYWANNLNGQDFGTGYQAGDLVYSNNFIYQCTQNNPAGGPIVARTNEGDTILSSYEETNWLPFWELNDQYDDIVFGHVGIPQSGKRSVGIELGIVDKYGKIVNKANLDADNPAPYILTEGFNVDSTGEATKVKFNFNYALGFQEKTTKVYLYRSSEPDFEITGSNGLPYDKVSGVNNPDSTLVSITLGVEGAAFGDNINQIIDEPPIDKIDGVDQITGYYYKILPFDDFGSGVLYNVPDGSMRRVIVYPKRYNNPNPNVMPGRVLRSNPTSTTDAVPGAIQNLTGSTSFENFFLNWNAPGSNFFDNNTSTDFENDIDHYEVWQSDDPYIKSGQNKNATSPWLEVENTGYRKIKGVAYSVSEGDTTPEESLDPARYIYGAENIFNVAANTPSVEVVHGGKTNDTKYFWVRAVDFAGNKSPFSSAANEVNVKGLGLNLGRASATDIAGFEINMTDTFNDAIASVPNNPFSQDGNGGLEWDEHVLFSEGTGYIVEGGGFGSDVGYIWWDKKDENGNSNLSQNYYVKTVNGVELFTNQSIDSLIEFEGTDLTNIYFSGVNYSGSNRHPAGSNNQTDKVADFDDGDFIIARNSDGVPTVVHHAFANALIGTANIAEASIINAKINDLSADKITAGQIKGHRIEVFHSGADQSSNYGSIASKDFSGIKDYPVSGFVLSGDGTFAFQQGDAALTFEDDDLILYGKLRQKNKLDFDFVDVDVEPNFFAYQETDAGFEAADDTANPLSIRATFRNSTAQPGNVRFKMEAVGGNQRYDVFGFDDTGANGSYDISGFVYNGDLFTDVNGSHIATGSFDVTGFDNIIQNYGQVADSVVLTASCTGISTIQRSATITRIIDGKVGESGNPGLSPTFRGIWDDQTDYIYKASTQTTDGRGDIVQFTGYNGYPLPNGEDKYYIAKKNSGPNNIQAPWSGQDIFNSTYWQEFGATFESVATDLLLTKEAIIKEKLTMGVGGSSTEVPHSGIIVSDGFVGGLLDVNTEPYEIIDNTNYFEDYDTPGFLLARTDDGVVFDVGGTGIIGQTGYIRFDSKRGKLEIAGSFINNTIIDENIIYTGVFELGQTDELTSFIGGGYNNKFIENSTEEFQNIGSSIVGGAWNEAQGRFSTIAGGYSGLCKDNFSFIGGGWHNQMPLLEPGNHQGANFIGCGIYNTISGGAGQIILNGGNNTLSGPTGSYEPILDFDNDLYSKYILGTGNSSLSLTAGGWATESWIGPFYSEGAGAFRGLANGGWIYSVNFGWSFIPRSNTFAYIDEPINGIWFYSEFHNNKDGWYWLSRPDEQNMIKFDIYNPNTEGLYAYYHSDSNWVFFDRTSSNQLRGYYYSSNTWTDLT